MSRRPQAVNDVRPVRRDFGGLLQRTDGLFKLTKLLMGEPCPKIRFGLGRIELDGTVVCRQSLSGIPEFAQDVAKYDVGQRGNPRQVWSPSELPSVPHPSGP